MITQSASIAQHQHTSCIGLMIGSDFVDGTACTWSSTAYSDWNPPRGPGGGNCACAPATSKMATSIIAEVSSCRRSRSIFILCVATESSRRNGQRMVDPLGQSRPRPLQGTYVPSEVQAHPGARSRRAGCIPQRDAKQGTIVSHASGEQMQLFGETRPRARGCSSAFLAPLPQRLPTDSHCTY